MNKKKLPGNISLPGNFFLFMRIIRLYLTGSPYGAKRNCYSSIFHVRSCFLPILPVFPETGSCLRTADKREGHIFGQAPGRHLTGAVLVVDDDVGVGVDDVGAPGLHLVKEAGVEQGRSRRAQAAQQQDKAQK